MTTIYVVTSGEYSYYRIEGVYSDRDAAELCAAAKDDCIGGATVEEYELDKHVDLLRSGRMPFDVYIGSRKGQLETIDVDVMRSNYTPSVVMEEKYGRINYFVNVVARDKEHAAKIAMEKVTQYRAMALDEHSNVD